MASATLMNRFAKSVSKMGSGFFNSPIVVIARVETIVEVITSPLALIAMISYIPNSHGCNTSLALMSQTKNAGKIKVGRVGIVTPEISCRPRIQCVPTALFISVPHCQRSRAGSTNRISSEERKCSPQKPCRKLSASTSVVSAKASSFKYHLYVVV